MTAITAFPTISNVLVAGNNIKSYIAGAAIKAGQVVAFHGTGVSEVVHPAIKGTTDAVAGVAIYGVASGARVAVAGAGCRVFVANADDTATIDAGDALEDNVAAVGGTVSIGAAITTAAIAERRFLVGTAVDDIAASGTGRADLICAYIVAPNTA